MTLQQFSLFDADHDGKTYCRERDKVRLNAQQTIVFNAMKDGCWRTLARIKAMTGAPEASISARLRDCKKPKFGGHELEKRHLKNGLWEYRLILKQEKQAA